MNWPGEEGPRCYGGGEMVLFTRWSCVEVRYTVCWRGGGSHTWCGNTAPAKLNVTDLLPGPIRDITGLIAGAIRHQASISRGGGVVVCMLDAHSA
jgi:hypothetical protein